MSDRTIASTHFCLLALASRDRINRRAPWKGARGVLREGPSMNRLSIGLSFLSALSAIIAARYWRAASQVYGKIDQLWLDRSDDIPDFIWATAALGAIKDSGDLNRKAGSWAAISAIVSFMAGAASFW